MSEIYEEGSVLEMLQTEGGRREAFSRIVAHYSGELYWKIRRLVLTHEDADAILMETWQSAWENIGYFRQEARMSTWLYRIALNKCLMFLNKGQMRTVSLEEGEIRSRIDQLSRDPLFKGDKGEMALQEALLRLPPKQRMVFIMRYYDQMSYDEMSDVMGTTIGALRSDYQHAVKRIKEAVARSLES